MAKQSTKPWEGKWKLGDPIGAGGQGLTYRASHASADDFRYVLKKLHRSEDQERRARMFREVCALRTLRHPQVVVYVDSNVERYQSTDELYLITEFIDGASPTGPVPLEDALAVMTKLLDAISYCHKQEIVHRDIKPGNIVLRRGSVHDPVLLDFGLSFNAIDADGFSTETGQNLGPRNFMDLPELTNPSDAKRSPASDVTQGVGLLFFLLTGQCPGHLLDHEGRLPHRRASAAQAISSLPRDVQPQLARIFDIGFKHDLNARWQTAKALTRELEVLRDGQVPRADFAQRLRVLKESIETSGAQRTRIVWSDILLHCRNVWQSQARYVTDALVPSVTVVGSHTVNSNAELRLHYTMKLNVDERIAVEGELTVRLIGSELVATSTPPTPWKCIPLFGGAPPTLPEHVERARILALDPKLIEQFTEAIHETLLDGVDALKRLSDRSAVIPGDESDTGEPSTALPAAESA